MRSVACMVIAVLVGACDQPMRHGPLFVNVAGDVGLGGVESNRVSFADFNSDGFPDLLVGCRDVYLNHAGQEYRAYDGPFIVDWPGQGPQMSVQIGDVNGDGFEDLFLGRYYDHPESVPETQQRCNEVWLGDGTGGFVRKAESGIDGAALCRTTQAACFVDVNRDGNLDLFVGNAYRPGGTEYEAFADQLFMGQGEGTFADATDEAGLSGRAEAGHADSRRPTYGATHTDWNNDGWQDLLVMSYGRQANRLWRNNGDGTFCDVAPCIGFDGDSDRTGVYDDSIKQYFRERYGVEREDELPFRSHGNTFDCAVADYDNDGDMDCFLAEVTHSWAGSSSDKSMLLVNTGADGGFTFSRCPDAIRRIHSSKNWNQGDLHAGWLDIDNDGLLDLLIGESDYPNNRLLLYKQISAGVFEDWTELIGVNWLNASQLALGDYDRDGATDIVVATSNVRLAEEVIIVHDLSIGLLRNVCAEREGNGFVNIRLSGQAIGARVIVECGDVRQLREVRGGLGHSGHHDDTDCRFGVGSAKIVDRVEIHWPDRERTIQLFLGVGVDSFYTVAKGDRLRRSR